jgi:alkylation response protein AidB-like acyl-CoA dehydrogenase
VHHPQNEVERIVLNRVGSDETHEIFRDSVRRFLAEALTPNEERYEREGSTDRAFWQRAGAAGLLCPQIPEAYGGLGLDFRYNAIVAEELAYAGSSIALGVHSDITPEYLIHYGTEEQKVRYLPGMVAGDCITAIVMTEPGGGSDLARIRTTARIDGDHYVVNGAKTFISNGQNADLLVMAARTGGEGAKGISMFLVDANLPGVGRGRNLDKIGQHSSDTSELFFSDVRVPLNRLLGAENAGFAMMMELLPQERLAIAISAQAAAQRAFDETVRFTKERAAFGKTVFDFQNTRFNLAEMATNLQVGWSHIDWAVDRLAAGSLTAAEASAAKLWHTEMQWKVMDVALQMHGGAGYMNEYLIARLWRDARVLRIYGGTSEIMKEVIGRSL